MLEAEVRTRPAAQLLAVVSCRVGLTPAGRHSSNSFASPAVSSRLVSIRKLDQGQPDL
jgi:hypothetical protein